MKFFKSIYNRFRLKIPDEIKQEFKNELVRSNYSKISIMAVVFYIMEFLLYILPSEYYNFNTEISHFLVVNILLIPTIWYINKNIKTVNILFAKVIQNIYALTVLLLGMFMALKYQKEVDFVHVYLMAVMGVVCFIYFTFWNRVVIFGFILALFIILLPYYQDDNGIVMIIFANAVVFNILAFFLSDMRIKNKLSSYINSKKLEMLAQTDSMTYLYNHESILLKLSQQIEKAKLTGEKLSLFMIDIDDFKSINDNFGHTKGDLVIKQVAEIIKNEFKKTDIIGRYGGDEFIIVLPNTDLKEADILEENLHNVVSKMEWPVKLSIGLSIYNGETLNEFVKKTDFKLYEAKKIKKENKAV